jgi:hypothetical protein
VERYDTSYNAKTMLDSDNYSDYALPLNGGTLGDGSNNVVLNIKGKGRSLIGYILGGENAGFLGFGAKNGPIFVTSDQTSMYNLLHSGNYADYTIPKNGGGEVQKASDIPFAVKNTTANSNTCLIGFTSGDGTTMAIGISGGKAVVSEQGEIFHQGNSARVTITNSSAVAPSDMEGLWAY